MSNVHSRPGHGEPADELADDPFVKELVDWTMSQMAALDAVSAPARSAANDDRRPAKPMS